MPDNTRNHGLTSQAQGHNDAKPEDKVSGAQTDDPLSRVQASKITNSHEHIENNMLNMSAQEKLPQNKVDTAQQAAKPSLLRRFFNFVLRRKSQNPEQNESELQTQHQTTTSWTPQEKRMLANIAELHEARVADIMIPRSDVESLDLDTSLAETLQHFEQSGHSRMPVYAETLDDPRGMIHIRDLLNYVTRASGICKKTDISSSSVEAHNSSKQQETINIEPTELDLDMPISKLGIIRDVLFVPVSMPAGRLLARMQASRTQIALVIDEHGGTDGLVSLEDIVEVIVGDIEDEHDDEDADIIKDAQGRWVIDAATELEELKEDLGIDFSNHEQAEAVDTLGGLIVTALDRIPARGEKLELTPHYMVQILDADQRKIKRVRLSRVEKTAHANNS